MRLSRLLLVSGMTLLLCAGLAVGQDDEQPTGKTWLWLGAHYTDFTDYTKKVGEYNLGNSELLPETKLFTFNRTETGYFQLFGHYYDDQNIFGELTGAVGEVFSGSIRYRSMIHQEGQDLLKNMSAREYFPETGTYGGKTLTHDITDPDADYNYNRHEVLSRLQVLLSRKNNVRLWAAHRSIVKKGEEQKISSSHCFSCHLTSQTAEMDQSTNSVEAGIQAEASDFTFGYSYGFREFVSEAPAATVYFDSARHPTDNSFDHAEFASRQLYSDTVLPIGVYPETRKHAHKVRINGKLGTGHLNTSLVYNQTNNDYSDLETTGLFGMIHYSLPIGTRTRVLARLEAKRLEADDPVLDSVTYREGRGGPAYSRPVFDGVRYSSLDRNEIKGTAELISRLGRRWTVSGLIGYHNVDRKDYVVPGDGTTSGTFIGQAKLNYRKGLRYSSRVKYRFEKTSDPFISGRGLFEHSIRDSLARSFKFIFYYEREDFRYQDITTSPTDRHEITWQSNWRPNLKTSLTLGLKFRHDKNSELDSLDVEHTLLQPHASLTLTPSTRWAITGGYNYYNYQSRGPVTVALFDG